MDEGTTTLPILPLTRPPDVDDEVAERIARAIAELDSVPSDVARSSGWSIDNLAAAEWAMRMRASALDRIREATDAVVAWRDQLNAWYDDATREDRRTAAVMGWFLEDYQLRRRAADDKLATLKLPSGRVTSTKRQPTVELLDADAVLAWLEAEGIVDGDLVDRSPRLRWAEVKKLARPVVVTDDDGAIVETYAEFPTGDGEWLRVPGIGVVAGHTTAKVAEDA